MKTLICFLLVIVLINSQNKNNPLITLGQQMQTANGFLIALSEVITKIQYGAKAIFSYFQPALNVVRQIRDTSAYIFREDHIITVLLIVIFLTVLLKEESNNHSNKSHQETFLEQQGEKILQQF